MNLRRQLPLTAVVLLIILVCLRLGVWQLDRRAEKQAENARLAAELLREPLLLNEALAQADWTALRDRPAVARGQFDYSQQVVLQGREGPYGQGVHLVAPFLLEGTGVAVLVDRGWVATAEWRAAEPSAFDETPAVVSGNLQPSATLPRAATGSEQLGREIFSIAIPLLQNQMPYPLLPVYLVQAPAPGEGYATRPYRAPQTVTLSEGNHLAYAVQWFSFAAIAAVGYIAYLRRRPA